MKTICFLFMIMVLSPLFSADLPAYVAEFDKSLAIELYRAELPQSADKERIYRSLAHLYVETGQTGLAEDCYRHLIRIGDGEAYRDYTAFLYDHAMYEKLRHTIRDAGLEGAAYRLLTAESYFREAHFDSCRTIAMSLSSEKAEELLRLSGRGLGIPLRSPLLGGAMSALVPGSGKMYAGRWMDGVQAFSMVAAPAFNAWYHFDKKGVRSVRGWIWSTAALWFYLSDIYGSVKAVREYNEAQKFKIVREYQP